MTHFKVTNAHWEIFIDFLESHTEFARGRINSSNGKEVYKRLWMDLTIRLNSAGLGEKSVEKWQKTWSDFKCCLKKKAGEISKSQRVTGGGPPIEKKLSEIELKIISILGDTFYKGCNVTERGLNFLENTHENGEEGCSQKRTFSCTLEKVEDVSIGANNLIPASSGTLKNEVTLLDHDYLFLNNASPTSTPKSKKAKTAESSESITQMYQETVTILKQIHNTVDSRLADISHSIDKLANAVSASTNNSSSVTDAAASITNAAATIANAATKMCETINKTINNV